MEKETVDNKNMINSIVRAIDILDLYNHQKTELGISEIASRLGIYKSTVHRIVSTLEWKGILEKNPENCKYKLGLKLYKIGVLARDENELIAVSMPHLENITNICGETSNLVIMDGSMSVYLSQQTSDKMVRIFTKVGARVFPHCNAAGKVLLSDMGEEEIEEIILTNGFPRYTDHTITDKEKLIEELKNVKMNGYAIDHEEREEGVMCVAAPIRDKSKRVIAAVSVSGPKYRIEELKLQELIELVKNKADEISKQLGFKL